MKKSIKHILAGAILGAVAMLVIGAGESNQTTGRFQGVSSSGFFMILDTQTGKAWAANLAGQNFNGTQQGFWDKKDN